MHTTTLSMILLFASVVWVAWCGVSTEPSWNTTTNHNSEELVNEISPSPTEKTTWNLTCDTYLEFLTCSQQEYPWLYMSDYQDSLISSFDSVPHDQLEEICTVLVDLDTETSNNDNSCAKKIYWEPTTTLK